MELKKIRNFCIISHIDHGKSTLADAILDVTNSIRFKKTALIMDDMELEQERGITIKLNTAQFVYKYRDVEYYLNLLDTPGHIDFNYEVKRAIHASQGAILLIDATKGIQAQTIANLKLAQQANLKIIPVINKIDLKMTQITNIQKILSQILKITSDKILLISAKKQLGIQSLLNRIVSDVPAPTGNLQKPLQALVFDAKYDHYRGILVFVQIKNGRIASGQKLQNLRTGKVFEILELGYKTPYLTSQNCLEVGQVGYLQTNIKAIREILIGDTLTSAQNGAKQPLLRFEKNQADVFANIFPEKSENYPELANAIGKIALSDAAFQYQKINTNNLGSGFHCGFLGLLHLEIIQERLEREYRMPVITTLPTVKYQFHFKNQPPAVIDNLNHITNWQNVRKIAEPVVDVRIIAPLKYLGEIMQLCIEKRGQYLSEQLFNNEDLIINFRMPLKEIVVNFLNELKNKTNGYGSFAYENEHFVTADLVKLDILINDKAVTPLSQIVHRQKSSAIGKNLCQKLKTLIHRQNIPIKIQAAINNQIIARENISALRKDVTAKCYGGDISRKRKLWEKQKAGKKRMRLFGKVQIPNKVFIQIIKK